MRQKVRAVILSVAGIAILGTAILHAVVNLPHLREDLLEIENRRALVSAVMLILSFSAAAMAAFGGLVLASAAQVLRGRPAQSSVLWVVAATYVIFGLAAFTFVNHTVHMLGYAVMGSLVAIGAMPGSTSPDRQPHRA